MFSRYWLQIQSSHIHFIDLIPLHMPLASQAAHPSHSRASACKAANKATPKIARVCLAPSDEHVTPNFSSGGIAVGTGAIQFRGGVGLRRTGELVGYLSRRR